MVGAQWKMSTVPLKLMGPGEGQLEREWCLAEYRGDSEPLAACGSHYPAGPFAPEAKEQDTLREK